MIDAAGLTDMRTGAVTALGAPVRRRRALLPYIIRTYCCSIPPAHSPSCTAPARPIPRVRTSMRCATWSRGRLVLSPSPAARRAASRESGAAKRLAAARGGLRRTGPDLAARRPRLERYRSPEPRRFWPGCGGRSGRGDANCARAAIRHGQSDHYPGHASKLVFETINQLGNIDLANSLRKIFRYTPRKANWGSA